MDREFGTNTESLRRNLNEHEQFTGSKKETNVRKDRIKYSVLVDLDTIDQHSSSDEALLSLFTKLVEDAGCSKSQIGAHTGYSFFVTLTDEQFKNMSGMDCVLKVRPVGYVYSPTCNFGTYDPHFG